MMVTMIVAVVMRDPSASCFEALGVPLVSFDVPSVQLWIGMNVAESVR
jgi:hypothetical protein